MFKAQTRSHLLLLVTTVFIFETLAQPVLALQASTGGMMAPAAAADTTKQDFEAFRHQMNLQMIEAMKTGFGGRDPAMRELMSIDLNRVEGGIVPNFSNAPIDADPFFMRSQSWQSNNTSVQEYSVVGDERSTEIIVPGLTRKLVLNIPLRSVIATDEYLFFTLHPKSDLFDRLSGVQGAEGDGLFVIETALLAQKSLRGQPVPVFFLPVAGKGLRYDVQAAQIVEGDILAVSNQTEVIPFLMKDIREMIQISKMNLDISVMISMTKRGSDGKVTDERLMPAPGSTAMLGLVITGLDTSRPGFNFFRDFKSLAANGAAGFDNVASESSFVESLANKVVRQFGFLNLFAIRDAKAQTAEDPVTAAIKRSMFFGSIVAVTIVTAFVLKYKSPAIRQRLDEIRKYREALDPNVKNEKMKGFRDFVRIEGSILASIAQFPLISPGIAVQYLVDRHAPSLGAGDHTLMRKVLNQTVYPNLRHFGKISVNEKVTMLGAGYAATAGIGLGALHSFYLLPMFVQAVSPSLPDGLGLALTETFSPANRETQATLFTNLLVGASIGILRGPADLTMDAKSQVVEELYARVDNDLRRLGINPNDPKVQTRREEMRDALINLTLVQKGLPTTAEILFDTMSLYSSVAKARGFATPTNDTLLANLNPLAKESAPFVKDEAGNQKLGEDGKPLLQEGSFILSSRRGLLPSVLSRALAQAKGWHQVNPSSDTAQAVRLVEAMISDSERVRTSLPKVAAAVLRYMESPSLLVGKGDPAKKAVRDADLARLKSEIRDISARALAFRQLIVMANYEGPTEFTARYLPVSWAQQYGAAATNMAVLYLRQALASQLDGTTVDNIVARRKDLERYGDQAVAKAIEALRKERGDIASNYTDAQIMANANLRAEVLQRANIEAKHYGDEQRANEAADRFVPKGSWVEEWRHRRALRRAEARLAQYTVVAANNPRLLSKENLEAQLRDYYTDESAKEIGLRIQSLEPVTEDLKDRRVDAVAPWQTDNSKYETMLKEIREKSELVAKQQIESRDMATYLSKLGPVERMQAKLQVYAAIFLASYRDSTTMTDIVSPLDTAQPGMTQSARIALTRRTNKDLATLDRLADERSGFLDRKLLKFRRGVVTIAASTANRGLRVIDSMFNDQSMDRGVMGIIQRRVPFAEEMVTANIRNLKFWPVAFSVSWVWSHYALGTGISYSFWVTAILTQGVFAMAPVQWLFRNYRMQAFKPYDTTKTGWAGVFQLGGKYGTAEMLAYAATFVAIMPAVLLTTEVGTLLTTRIGAPVAQAMQGFSLVEVSTVAITGLLSYVAGSKIFENWKMKRTLARLSALDKTSSLNDTAKASEAKSSGPSVTRTCEGLFVPAGR